MPIPYNFADETVKINSEGLSAAKEKVVADLDAIISDWKNVKKAALSVVNCKDFQGEGKKKATHLVSIATKRINSAEHRKAGLLSKLSSDSSEYILSMDKRLKDLEKSLAELEKDDAKDKDDN